MQEKNRTYNNFSKSTWQYSNKSMQFVSFSKDPFVEIDRRITKNTNISNSNSNMANFVAEKKHKVRRIYQRNIVISVVLSILTFGIYNLFWQYEIAKETNALCKDDSNFTPCLVVVFNILTLGIYGVYWSYCIGRKHSASSVAVNGTQPDYYVLYLVLSLVSYLILPLQIVCYGFMQSKINEMVAAEDLANPKGIYVKDSSVFNRPFLSAVILLLISQEVPSQLVSIYEFFFRGQLGNPLNILDYDDVSTGAIQNSAEQVVNANS